MCPYDECKKEAIMKHIQFKNLVIPVILTGLMVISGCAASSHRFGRMISDDQVKQSFETFTVDPAYTYYYYGPRNFPQAVVGISRGHALVSEDWRPIELTTDQLRDWVWLQAKRLPGDFLPYGSTILDPAGKPAGIWYSLKSWGQWARIEFVDDVTMRIGAPVDHKHRTRLGIIINS
jgi:hypothetical protein